MFHFHELISRSTWLDTSASFRHIPFIVVICIHANSGSLTMSCRISLSESAPWASNFPDWERVRISPNKARSACEFVALALPCRLATQNAIKYTNNFIDAKLPVYSNYGRMCLPSRQPIIWIDYQHYNEKRLIDTTISQTHSQPADYYARLDFIIYGE